MKKTFAVLILCFHLVEHMVNQSRLAHSSWGDESYIPLISKSRANFIALCNTVTEVFRTFVSIYHKGVV